MAEQLPTYNPDMQRMPLRRGGNLSLPHVDHKAAIPPASPLETPSKTRVGRAMISEKGVRLGTFDLTVAPVRMSAGGLEFDREITLFTPQSEGNSWIILEESDDSIAEPAPYSTFEDRMKDSGRRVSSMTMEERKEMRSIREKLRREIAAQIRNERRAALKKAEGELSSVA